METEETVMEVMEGTEDDEGDYQEEKYNHWHRMSLALEVPYRVFE